MKLKQEVTMNIRRLRESDITVMVEAFARANWPKTAIMFKKYLEEQQNGTRLIWLAYVDNQFAGYVTLLWQSQYKSFASAGIPEIMDLNVLPSFRNQGVGAQLLQRAEQEAATRGDIVGLGVGLYAGDDGGYGSAQRLYVKRGYVPDGKGITYNYQPTIPGNSYLLDDDLVLWFTKELKKNLASFLEIHLYVAQKLI